MKLFSRYIFLLLAVFFASPIAGKTAQRHLKHQLIINEIKVNSESTNSSDKSFFCEQEENPENNLEELEEDETINKFLLASQSNLLLYLFRKTIDNSCFIGFCNSGKLFLLFHSLKLYC